MFQKSTILVLVFGVFGFFLVAETFPIKIKDIQFLFPPQNTIISENSKNLYETKIDRQVGDSEEEEKIRKDCIKKQNSENSETESTTTSSAIQEDSGNFNDTSPINGTIVDDPMEVKIYRAECDD
ncbi:unnamed protein product [Caenorhabditis nigoni]